MKMEPDSDEYKEWVKKASGPFSSPGWTALPNTPANPQKDN